MSRWNDDEGWSDYDDLPTFEKMRPARRPAEREPESLPPVAPVEDALIGGVYWVADRLWGFSVADRNAHPGVCVRCQVPRQQAVMVKGTSVKEIRGGSRFNELVVEPTAENGLERPTKFSMEPRLVSLRILRRIHFEEGPCGRIAPDVLAVMDAKLADLERALTEGRP